MRCTPPSENQSEMKQTEPGVDSYEGWSREISILEGSDPPSPQVEIREAREISLFFQLPKILGTTVVLSKKCAD